MKKRVDRVVSLPTDIVIIVINVRNGNYIKYISCVILYIFFFLYAIKFFETINSIIYG